MASNHQNPDADTHRGSKKGGDTPGMNMQNMGMNLPQGMGIMPQTMGIPLNLSGNMGSTFMQGVMSAMGNMNGQTNQQMNGLMHLNNQNMANINMNMGFNRLNQNQGQHNAQIQLMNLIAQQRNQQQAPIQASTSPMHMQPLMGNQTPMQAQHSLSNQHLQLLRQQQQLLQMNLQKRQNELQQNELNSSSPNMGWNPNGNVPAGGGNEQMSSISPVHHLQIAPAKAQNQLNHWQLRQESGGNRQKQSPLSPSPVQNNQSFQYGSNAPTGQNHLESSKLIGPNRAESSVSQNSSSSTTSLGQNHLGSSVFLGKQSPSSNAYTTQYHQGQVAPSSKIITSGVQHNNQERNQSQPFYNSVQAPLTMTNLFTQSCAPSTPFSRQNYQSQSRIVSNMASSALQNNQRLNQSQRPTNQQTPSEGQRQIPNHVVTQQSQQIQMMQSMQNHGRAASNFLTPSFENSQGQTQQRRSSDYFQTPSAVVAPMRNQLHQMGNMKLLEQESKGGNDELNDTKQSKSPMECPLKSIKLIAHEEAQKKIKNNSQQYEAADYYNQNSSDASSRVIQTDKKLQQKSSATEPMQSRLQSSKISTPEACSTSNQLNNQFSYLSNTDFAQGQQPQILEMPLQSNFQQQIFGFQNQRRISDGQPLHQQEQAVQYEQQFQQGQFQQQQPHQHSSGQQQSFVIQSSMNKQYEQQQEHFQQQQQRPSQLPQDDYDPKYHHWKSSHQPPSNQLQSSSQINQRLVQQQNTAGMNKDSDYASAVMDVNVQNQIEHTSHSLINQRLQLKKNQSSPMSQASLKQLSEMKKIYNPRSKKRSLEGSGEESIKRVTTSVPVLTNSLHANELMHPQMTYDQPSVKAKSTEKDSVTKNFKSQLTKTSEIVGTCQLRQTASQTAHSLTNEHLLKMANKTAHSLTYEQLLKIANKLSVEERIVFATKQLLGPGKNGFSRVTSAMQRMKRQRARQGAAGGEGEEFDNEHLKKKTFNVRFAKNLYSEMTQGLQFTNMMTEVLKSIIQEVDPDNPLLKVPMPLVFDPEQPKNMTTKPTVTLKDKQRSDEVLDNHTKTFAEASGSVLQINNHKLATIDPSLMETIQDDDDKKLTKSEIEYRLFETLRWKTLEIGDSVAAKVDSQESWILGRVVKKWESPGLSYREMKDLSDIKRDALFNENVYIQDHNEYNGDMSNLRVVARKHIIPLPQSKSKSITWRSIRVRKGCRVFALFPGTSSLLPATVISSSTCKNKKDVVVVEFDDEKDEAGVTPHREVPAHAVTLIPRESKSYKRKRKSTAAARKRLSDTSVDRMLLEMLK